MASPIPPMTPEAIRRQSDQHRRALLWHQRAVSPDTVESWSSADRSITVDGVARRYLITIPEPRWRRTEPVPVVFDFHGLMEGADIHSTMTGYSEVAQQEGFVVVFPEGTGQPLRWDISGDPSTNADLAYFDALLEEVGNTECIDTSRVYATGLSNGAMFTSFLICERSEVLAAAAPVAGVTDSRVVHRRSNPYRSSLSTGLRTPSCCSTAESTSVRSRRSSIQALTQNRARPRNPPPTSTARAIQRRSGHSPHATDVSRNRAIPD